MDTQSPVYEQTYQKYLKDLEGIDIPKACRTLGLEYRDGLARLRLVDRLYAVSPEGVTDANGEKPNLGVSVVLCRFLLMCPDAPPKDGGWTTFRDIKGAGPLTVLWANDVERAISDAFDQRPGDLEKAGALIGANKPDQEYSYDVEFQVPALSRIPVLVLFNDSDDTFPSKCTVLFRQSAGTYLDPESLAILGGITARTLVRRASTLLAKAMRSG